MGQRTMTLVALPGLHLDWHNATSLYPDNHTSRMSLTPISARNLKFIVLTGICQFASRYANRTWKEFDFCLNATRSQYGYCAM